jgi:hypothetical protein
MRRPEARALAAAASLILVRARPAVGQAAPPGPRLQPELRVDGIFARRAEVHAGLGASVPLGGYVRAELVGAVGAREGEAPGRTGRVDLVARFLLDPYRELRWGAYGAGGASQRLGPGGRTYLVAAIGIEAPPVRGWLPTFELGLGGGARVGLIARREIRGAR